MTISPLIEDHAAPKNHIIASVILGPKWLSFASFRTRKIKTGNAAWGGHRPTHFHKSAMIANRFAFPTTPGPHLDTGTASVRRI